MSTPKQLRFAQAVRDAIAEEMRRDPRVFLMGEDVEIGIFASTRGLVQEFGRERVRDTPISEAAIAGAAVGAAAAGMRPIADLMVSTFMYIAMDQIANQAACMRYQFGGQVALPIVYKAVTGVMGSAAAHHSQCLHPKFMNIPGLKVALPSEPADAKGLLKSAIRDDNPVVFLEHASLGGMRGPVPDGEYLVPLGQGDIKRPGSDVTVVAMGLMVSRALEAAKALEAEGISVEVIDPRTLVPLDRKLILESVARTGRLVVVDEAHLTCSAASEIAATVAEEGFRSLKAPIKRVTSYDVPIPFSPPLEQFVVPDAGRIAAGIRAVLRS